MTTETADIKRWAQTWRRAGEALEAIRRKELAAMTSDMAREAAYDVLNSPVPADLPPRLDTGLVEQQRLFKKLHGVA